MTNMDEPLLKVRDLRLNFYTYAGVVQALDGIDFEVHEGETFGLVGETGCGKSVTAASILRLVDQPGKIVGGEVLFKGEDLLKKTEEEMRRIRGRKIAIVFQDPMTYLNPVLTVGDQISEAVEESQDLTHPISDMENKMPSSTEKKPTKKALREAALQKVKESLRAVRMPNPDMVVTQYPHELSGGMRQRAMIAMAISCIPEFMILDEATTFLDVTIQRQILDLVRELQGQLGCALLIITHNMGIIAEMCDRVAVMYAGNIVECAGTRALFRKPLHPYTRGLLSAIPNIAWRGSPLSPILGSVPNLITPPSGCRFHPRCPQKVEACSSVKPEIVEVEPGHTVACHLFDGKNGDH